MRRTTGDCYRVSIVLALALGALTARASTLVPQTPLPGDCIPQFVTPLPVFGPGYNAALPRVDTTAHQKLIITMKETSQQVLPNFTPAAGCPNVVIQPTRLWVYETSDASTGKVLGPAHWPAVSLDKAIVCLKHCSTELAHLFPSHRRATLESVASGTLTANDAIARVEMIRFLDRLAHHAWRASAHIAGAIVQY